MEEKVCGKLGLQIETVATQVIQRDRHAEFMAALALIAGCVEKIAVEIRHLQRTEVLEAEGLSPPGKRALLLCHIKESRGLGEPVRTGATWSAQMHLLQWKT